MKFKSAHTTAGIGKLHGYLGHFAQPKHINRGHNSDPIPRVTITAKRMTPAEARAYDEAQQRENEKQLPSAGDRQFDAGMSEVMRAKELQKTYDKAGQDAVDLKTKRASEGKIKY